MTIKQKLKAEALNKEADKWLKCYEKVERCSGGCENCKYDTDFSMFNFVSAFNFCLIVITYHLY